MHIPKIEFREMTLEENMDIIKWAYFEGDSTISVHNYIIQYFPELAKLDTNLSYNDICKEIEKVVTKHYNQSIAKIKKDIKLYHNLWKKYNDKYFKELSYFLDVNWPIDVKKIVGKVGIIPIFPRCLDDFSFSIGIDIDSWKVVEICAHETLHFLWFEKWAKLYPNTPRYEYNSPYLIWQYSEMVTDPILNNKPFSEIFDFIEHGYDSFYKIKDGNTNVMDKLRNIYSKNISIEDKIKYGFEYIKKIFNENNKK